MPERYYHALEFVPRKSDPNRRWALSVKQPLAALVARGITPLVIKSKLPPPELMGKRIALHAGAGDVPYKDFSEHAASWTKVIWGVELSDLRLALPKSAVIATVKLEAAFRVKRVAEARAYAHRGNAYSAPFAGLWERHDTRPVFEMGPIEGRYAWALTEPKLCARPVPLKGMGGLFDLEAALSQQRADDPRGSTSLTMRDEGSPERDPCEARSDDTGSIQNQGGA